MNCPVVGCIERLIMNGGQFVSRGEFVTHGRCKEHGLIKFILKDSPKINKKEGQNENIQGENKTVVHHH